LREVGEAHIGKKNYMDVGSGGFERGGLGSATFCGLRGAGKNITYPT